MPDDISPDSIVSRKQSIVHSVLDDEVLALDVDSGTAFVLRCTGPHIWSLLEKPISVQNICDRLCEMFQVDEKQCRDEVIAFLRRLKADGVIQLR